MNGRTGCRPGGRALIFAPTTVSLLPTAWPGADPGRQRVRAQSRPRGAGRLTEVTYWRTSWRLGGPCSLGSLDDDAGHAPPPPVATRPVQLSRPGPSPEARERHRSGHAEDQHLDPSLVWSLKRVLALRTLWGLQGRGSALTPQTSRGLGPPAYLRITRLNRAAVITGFEAPGRSGRFTSQGTPDAGRPSPRPPPHWVVRLGWLVGRFFVASSADPVGQQARPRGAPPPPPSVARRARRPRLPGARRPS